MRSILRSLAASCGCVLLAYYWSESVASNSWIAWPLGLGLAVGIWAIAPRGTGLGGPEEPEPDKPSPRFARHPISQGEI